MNKKDREGESPIIYDYFFHESRFPIVEKQLSPENAKKFKELSNEDKALFINILIEKGVLAW